MATSEAKLAKAFEDAAAHRLFNPFHFANIVKTQGGFSEAMLRDVAVGVFLLGEIDYRYGLGDAEWNAMCSRVVEIIAEYRDLPAR